MTHTEFLEFVAGPSNNGWFYSPDMQVYVRKGWHFNLKLMTAVHTFDIANITVTASGTGVFTRWYAQVREWAKDAGFTAVFIEQVSNTDFANSLAKRGLQEQEGPCFFDMLGA